MKRAGLFDFNDPFYRPLWLRVAIVAACGLWGIFEFATGNPFWGVLFCGVAAIAGHGFFIAFEPRDPKGTDPDKE